MTARTVRRLVVVVWVTGVAGMIVTSIAGRNGLAMTFGLATAVATLCLLLTTSLEHGAGGRPVDDDAQAARVEALVERVVEQGADERLVRELAREAVKLGRGGAPAPPVRPAG